MLLIAFMRGASGNFQALARHLPFVMWGAGNGFVRRPQSFRCPHSPLLGKSTSLGSLPVSRSSRLLVGPHPSEQTLISVPCTYLAQCRTIGPHPVAPETAKPNCLLLISMSVPGPLREAPLVLRLDHSRRLAESPGSLRFLCAYSFPSRFSSTSPPHQAAIGRILSES